jgi:hypothetical protein
MPKPRYWTIGELSKRWATQSGPLPITTNYNWIRNGKLKATKLGGKTVFTAEAVHKFENPSESETPNRLAAVDRSMDAKTLADKLGY